MNCIKIQQKCISRSETTYTVRSESATLVLTRVSDPHPDLHFWRPWIRIHISNADPDPRLIIELEIQKGKHKINHFFTS